MRKFFKKIHLWISVPAGLVISITCLTGAILVFEKEILALAHPQLYRCEVPEGSGMMSREEIAQSLSSIYVPGIEGQAEVSSVRLPDKENGCAMVTFKGAGRKTLSVNPYTGEINGWVERSGFFTTVRQLHRWMLDVPETKGSKTVGKTVVGISTLLMVVILLSGLASGFRKVRGCSAHGSAYHARKAGSVSCTTAMCHWDSTACFCSLSWPLPALHGLSAGTAMFSMRSQEPNPDS